MPQHNNVYYLGPEGSFSDTLVKKVLGRTAHLEMCSSFTEVAEKTKNQTDSVGVLCVENSISSDVQECMDIMFHDKLRILGEAYLIIKMDLIGLKGATLEGIKEVYSHPQGIMQCSEIIKNNNWAVHKTNSTAEGKQIILEKNDFTKAAIGSPQLLNDLGVILLAEDIANVKHNMTRFIFVSNKDMIMKELSKNSNKLTYILQLKHEPGSLATLLSELAKEKVNLTKIQSKPIPGTDWEYSFWIDMEIPFSSQEKVDSILSKNTVEFISLGAYEKGKTYSS
jgi:chorismate mutase/prephenate dehydratase